MGLMSIVNKPVTVLTASFVCLSLLRAKWNLGIATCCKNNLEKCHIEMIPKDASFLNHKVELIV